MIVEELHLFQIGGVRQNGWRHMSRQLSLAINRGAATVWYALEKPPGDGPSVVGPAGRAGGHQRHASAGAVTAIGLTGGRTWGD